MNKEPTELDKLQQQKLELELKIRITDEMNSLHFSDNEEGKARLLELRRKRDVLEYGIDLDELIKKL